MVETCDKKRRLTPRVGDLVDTEYGMGRVERISRRGHKVSSVMVNRKDYRGVFVHVVHTAEEVTVVPDGFHGGYKTIRGVPVDDNYYPIRGRKLEEWMKGQKMQIFNDKVVRVKEGAASGFVYNGQERIGRLRQEMRPEGKDAGEIVWVCSLDVWAGDDELVARVYGRAANPEHAVDAAIENAKLVAVGMKATVKDIKKKHNKRKAV